MISFMDFPLISSRADSSRRKSTIANPQIALEK
jgi:hypothetical protein